MSDGLFATSTELASDNIDHVQEAGCNMPQSGKSDTDAVCVDEEIKDCQTKVCNNETCDNCGTENSARTVALRTLEDTEACSNPSSAHVHQSEALQGFIQDLQETLSQSDQKANKSYEHQGARPKVADKSKNRQQSSNTHLSNKKRKELAKQEKKKRREERRKDDNMSSCHDSSVAPGEQNAAGVVADLGLLAI